MTDLLEGDPYGIRNQDQFLTEMNALTQHHLTGCREYQQMFREHRNATSASELPWVHVGVFKHIRFQTESEGIKFGKTLNSSATTSGTPSQIVLDSKSSGLQRKSSTNILENVVGSSNRPLLIIDSSKSLRSQALSARLTAAMSLKPLATEFYFLLEDPDVAESMKWDVLNDVLARESNLLVYGFTWILWLAWAQGKMPEKTQELLRGTKIHFVHSGGWKKLEQQKVTREQFDSKLLSNLDPLSKVVDFYGLVEQTGVIFPLAKDDCRLVPAWADCIVRDPWTLEPIYDKPGVLQLMNLLAWGAPYHSVLTEDIAIMPRPEKNETRRFKLLGRIPKAENRGCANV